MKTMTATRKFLTVAFAAAALAGGFLTTINAANAKFCTFDKYNQRWICR